jgi:hypothetical protein
MERAESVSAGLIRKSGRDKDRVYRRTFCLTIGTEQSGQMSKKDVLSLIETWSVNSQLPLTYGRRTDGIIVIAPKRSPYLKGTSKRGIK